GINEVAEESEQHSGPLRARMPHLAVVIPPGTESVAVTIDGGDVAPALLARPLPLDPGSYAITARAPRRAFSTTDTVAEGRETRVDVVFTEVPIAVSATSVAAPPADEGPRPEAPRAEHGSSGTRRTLGWALIGTGGGALVGAAISLGVRG